jgi:hypothetical protein
MQIGSTNALHGSESKTSNVLARLIDRRFAAIIISAEPNDKYRIQVTGRARGKVPESETTFNTFISEIPNRARGHKTIEAANAAAAAHLQRSDSAGATTLNCTTTADNEPATSTGSAETTATNGSSQQEDSAKNDTTSNNQTSTAASQAHGNANDNDEAAAMLASVKQGVVSSKSPNTASQATGATPTTPKATPTTTSTPTTPTTGPGAKPLTPISIVLDAKRSAARRPPNEPADITVISDSGDEHKIVPAYALKYASHCLL